MPSLERHVASIEEQETGPAPESNALGSWAFAKAARPGTVHELPKGCQDRADATVRNGVLAAVVADGAGTASHGGEGAEAAVRAFLEAAPRLGVRPSRARRPRVLQVLQAVRDAVEVEARIAGRPPSDFSCTLVGAVASMSGCLVIQVGDGAAVVETDAGFHVPVTPVRCEHVNETFFVTSPGAEARLAIGRVHRPVASVTLVTDGLQDCVIGCPGDKPHVPFFASVTKRLAPFSGHDAMASTWLESVLASAPVTSRTDDDTCIVVARRVP